MIELTDTQRFLLQDVLRKECLPLFPNYFERVAEKRTSESGAINSMSPSWDIFQMCMEKGEENGQLNPRLTCVLPCPRGFWDTWMAFYFLNNPKEFPEISVVAKSILAYLKTLKLDLTTFINFESFHLKYLINVAQGHVPNFFIIDPISTVFSLKSAPFIEMNRKEMDPYDWALSEEAKPQLAKMLEEIEKHFEETYGKNAFDFLKKETQ